MSNDYFMVIDAATRFVNLEEEQAGRVLDSLLNVSSRENDVVVSGERGAHVHKTHIGEFRKIVVEALVEPGENAVTLVTIQDEETPLGFYAAVDVMRQRFSTRPVVQVVNLNSTIGELQDALRRTLAMYSVRLAVDPAPAGTAVPMRARFLKQARRWKTAEARNSLKDVLDFAMVEPQIVEREGMEYIVIEKGLYKRIEQPMTPAQMARHFGQNQLVDFEFAAAEKSRRGSIPAAEFSEIA